MVNELDRNVFVRSLERRRDMAGFSDKTLAVAAGMNATGIRDILKNQKNMPRYDSLFKISQVLGCTVEELVFDRRIMNQAPSPMAIKTVMLYILDHCEHLPNTSKANLLLKAYHYLCDNPRAGQDKVRGFLDGLIVVDNPHSTSNH